MAIEVLLVGGWVAGWMRGWVDACVGVRGCVGVWVWRGWVGGWCSDAIDCKIVLPERRLKKDGD